MPIKSRSPLVNKNVNVDGRRTSIRLEPESWEALRDICLLERLTKDELFARIKWQAKSECLTSAVRVYLLQYFRTAANLPVPEAATA